MVDDLPEAGRLELRVGEERLERVDDRRRDGGAIGRVEPLGRAPGGADLAQLLVQHLDVGEARFQRREARIGEEIRPPGDREERPPVRVGIGDDGQIAVPRAERAPPAIEDPLVAGGLERWDERLAVEVLHHDVGDHGLEHRHLDGLPLAGPLAVEQRRQHRGEHGERARLVGDDRRYVARLAHEGGLERREPRGRLDDVVVRGLVAVGAARAKAVGRAVDEPGVDGAERLVLEAEPRRWSGPEVVQDDVSGRREPEQRAASGGLLEIEDQAALVPVAGEVERRHAGVSGRPEAARRVAFGGLDLDDVGAQVAQGLRGPGAEHDGRDVEDADAYERSGHVAPRPRSVPARNRSCRCSTFGSGTTSDTTGVIRRAATRRAACATSQREAYRDPMMLISACTLRRGATSVTTPGKVVRRTSRPCGPSASRQAPRVCAVPTRSIATAAPPGATARTQSERSGVSASSAASAPNSLTALSLWVPRSIAMTAPPNSRAIWTTETPSGTGRKFLAGSARYSASPPSAATPTCPRRRRQSGSCARRQRSQSSQKRSSGRRLWLPFM